MEINLIREQSITLRTEAVIQAEASSADMVLSEDAPVLRGPSRRGCGLGGVGPLGALRAGSVEGSLLLSPSLALVCT